MSKIISHYFRENSELIKKRFNETSIEHLKIGNLVNIELQIFNDSMEVAKYCSDFSDYILIRADFCINLLENYFDSDETEDKERFKILHKGTPYYFIALGRILNRDYQGFGYYMDMAVVQDNKNMNFEHRAEGSAAEKTFLGFDGYSSEFWFDNTINKYVFGQIQKMFDDYKRDTPESNYEISDFKDKFVVNNLRDKNNPFHTIVTSFYSWVHECQYLVWLLNISPPEQDHNGSMEPFYLHLAKGALILESIGKMIIYKKTGNMINGTLGGIVNEDLNIDLFGIKTTITQDFENSRINTLDQILHYVATHSTFDKVTIYKIILTIRNTASHNLNWGASNDFAKTQKYLYFIMVYALFSMIELIP